MSDKQVTYCKCGIPVGKRLGSRELEIIQRHSGFTLKRKLAYTGDDMSVTCEKCGGITTFMTRKISLPMTYVVLPQAT